MWEIEKWLETFCAALDVAKIMAKKRSTISEEVVLGLANQDWCLKSSLSIESTSSLFGG